VVFETSSLVGCQVRNAYPSSMEGRFGILKKYGVAVALSIGRAVNYFFLRFQIKKAQINNNSILPPFY
jgi:hypothetical protein